MLLSAQLTLSLIVRLAVFRGNHSLAESAGAGTIDNLLTEITGVPYPITFTGADVNSYRATDLTGAQVLIADTYTVICNTRWIVIDGSLLPVANYYELPQLTLLQVDAALSNTTLALAPAPGPEMIADQAPAQAPAPALLRGKLRF